MSTKGVYKVYALKYAERKCKRQEHFIGGDPLDEEMPMDYFVWAVVDADKTWVVDAGFDRRDAEQRCRNLVRRISEGLAAMGIEASKIEDLIVTHMHYDHIGGLGQFPKARLHLQEKEIQYACSRHMAHEALSHAYTAEHIAAMVHEVYKGRVVFYNGDMELAPGLSVHLVGGHTMGLQVVRVRTGLGWLVLASDASHYYENMEAGRPFPVVHNVGDMIEGYGTMRRLADSPRYIIPGHDPMVLRRYPAAAPGLEGIAVRLDVETKTAPE